MTEDSAPILKVDSLVTGYGNKRIVDGLNLAVSPGEIVAVAIIGHNGAGKSTLLKAIFGVLPIWDGRVLFRGEEVRKPSPSLWLSKGVTYVPQGNRVFTDLTVRENLEMGGVTLQPKSDLDGRIKDVLDILPALRPRARQRAGTLSGGEKQMLALAMGLITSPKLILLDEPSLGLAPPLVSDVLNRIQRIVRESHMSALIVEQKVREVIKIAQRVYVLRNGRISFSGPTEALKDEAKLRQVYL